jgi:hypothetical protein
MAAYYRNNLELWLPTAGNNGFDLSLMAAFWRNYRHLWQPSGETTVTYGSLLQKLLLLLVNYGSLLQKVENKK